MKASEANVVWVPNSENVRVERHGQWKREDGVREMWMPADRLGEMGQIKAVDENMTRLAVFVLFHTIVVGDRVDLDSAHRAFLEIDEYRLTISPDIQGAADD